MWQQHPEAMHRIKTCFSAVRRLPLSLRSRASTYRFPHTATSVNSHAFCTLPCLLQPAFFPGAVASSWSTHPPAAFWSSARCMLQRAGCTPGYITMSDYMPVFRISLGCMRTSKTTSGCMLVYRATSNRGSIFSTASTCMLLFSMASLQLESVGRATDVCHKCRSICSDQVNTQGHAAGGRLRARRSQLRQRSCGAVHVQRCAGHRAALHCAFT